jgi:hypothetical protein
VGNLAIFATFDEQGSSTIWEGRKKKKKKRKKRKKR